MAIEIVDLPNKDRDFPYYVSLPEGSFKTSRKQIKILSSCAEQQDFRLDVGQNLGGLDCQMPILVCTVGSLPHELLCCKYPHDWEKIPIESPLNPQLIPSWSILSSKINWCICVSSQFANWYHHCWLGLVIMILLLFYWLVQHADYPRNNSRIPSH